MSRDDEEERRRRRRAADVARWRSPMPAPRFRIGHGDEAELEVCLLDYFSLAHDGRGATILDEAACRIVVAAADDDSTW